MLCYGTERRERAIVNVNVIVIVSYAHGLDLSFGLELFRSVLRCSILFYSILFRTLRLHYSLGIDRYVVLGLGLL